MPESETLTGPYLGDASGLGALTLGGVLIDRCDRFGEREALVFDDPLRHGATIRWAYGGLLEQSRRVAKALLSVGVGKETRVGLLMGNRPEAVAALFGAALVGAIVVPLSTFSTRTELSHLLTHADIGVLLTQTTMANRHFADDLVELSPAVAGPGPIHDAAHPHLRYAAAIGSDSHGMATWESFLDRGGAISDALLDSVSAQVHRADPAVIVCSSGTTAEPKAVLHCHEAIARQWWTLAALFGRDEFTRVWCPLPMFWTAGLNVAMGSTLAAGATWVMQELFEPGEALRLIEREHVTEPHVFAHQARSLEEHPGWSSADLSSCTKVFGKSVFTRHPTVEGDRSWNMPVGYGMSETASFVTGLPSDTPREAFRKGSYGRLLPGNELRVVDPGSGRALEAGEQGELIVRGPTLMERYVKRTRAESVDGEGWYHTGDLGHVDDDGHVYFDGRRTEMIKTAGANVSPAEIEVQLQAYAPIKRSRVVGVPDDRRDEIVVLCVTLKDDATSTEAEIKAFLSERVATYKVPERVLFFADEEMPMNRNGTKVQIDRLLAVVQQRLNR